MNQFVYSQPPPTYTNQNTGTKYIPSKLLGSGTYGSVFELDGGRILKAMEDTQIKLNSFISEVELQQRLYQKEPGTCPRISDYGRVPNKGEYMIVMEKMDGTVRDLLKTNAQMSIEFLKQIAVIFKKLEKYQFNHRDFKSDNAMYKLEGDKYRFVLIDFGFSCATIDGRKYKGTSYFPPKAKCFRRSRDLAQCVYEIEKYTPNLPTDIREFLRLLLTFNIAGKKCEMFKGCPPHKIERWIDTYDFLDNDAIENPHTTPNGLLQAIHVFETKGLEACKNGFIIDPVLDTCVPKPNMVIKPVLDYPKTPVPHVLNPVILKQEVQPTEPILNAAPVEPGYPAFQECPDGKVKNPKTGRCVKATGAVGKKVTGVEPKPRGRPRKNTVRTKTPDCPPDKVRNPKTRRCVKRTGAVGKKLEA